MDSIQAKINAIPYSVAATFINALEINGLASVFDYQITGVFKARKIRKWVKERNSSGFMFWFGVDEGDVKPQLSIERKGKKFMFSEYDLPNYKPNRPWIHSLGLRTPKHIDRFDLSKLPNINREASVESYLRSQSEKPRKGFKRIDSSKVRKMTDDFRSLLLLKNQKTIGFTFFSLEEEPGVTYNGITKKHWELFFEQGSVEYIRYYFGFNKDKIDHPLCLILVPVNEEGKNFSFQDLDDDARKLLKEPKLLEVSWPPKPST